MESKETKMDLIKRIDSLISPSLYEMGLSLVRIQLSGKERVKLQIMIERHDKTCRRGPMHAFFRDVWGSKEKFFEYIQYGL